MLKWLLPFALLTGFANSARCEEYYPLNKVQHQERLFCLTVKNVEAFLTDLGAIPQEQFNPKAFFAAELAKKVMCVPLSADLTYKGVVKKLTIGTDTYDVLRFTGGTKQAEIFSWAQVKKTSEAKPPPALFKFNWMTKQRDWQWVNGDETIAPTLIHDTWANNEPVPPWVKKACCGPEDAHHLTAEQVHFSKDGWTVDGYQRVIPNGAELPSPDGTYWIFYRTFSDGSQTSVYCFFVPIPSM